MPKRKKKRKNSKGGLRRKRDPYAALKKEMHPRTRWEYIDQDYFNKLTPEEKKFMCKFIDEYYGASLAPNEDKKQRRKDLHRTNKLRKECRDMNNRRNRDVISLNKAVSTELLKTDTIGTLHISDLQKQEDTLIELIDMNNSTLNKSNTSTKKNTDR